HQVMLIATDSRGAVITDKINLTVLQETVPFYNINIIGSPSNGGTATVTGTGPNYAGKTINVSALAKAGFTFKWWRIQLSPGTTGTVGTGSPDYAFIMPSNDVTITAVFEGKEIPEQPA